MFATGNVWDRLKRFFLDWRINGFDVACRARPSGTGHPAKLIRIFRLCKLAAPATGLGRGRDPEGARAEAHSPSPEPGGAEIGRAGEERKRADWQFLQDYTWSYKCIMLDIRQCATSIINSSNI